MISITRGDTILRLELIRLHSKSARPYKANGDYQSNGLGDILEGPVGSSLQHPRRGRKYECARRSDWRTSPASYRGVAPNLTRFLRGASMPSALAVGPHHG